MNATQTQDRTFLKLIAAILFMFFFLSVSLFALVRWADEGPSVRYTPPAYHHMNR